MPRPIPSGPQASNRLDVEGGADEKGCEDPPDDENKGSCDVGNGCDRDNDWDGIGVELAGGVEPADGMLARDLEGVVQRPRNWPKGPQGSIAAEDDGAGEEEGLTVCAGDVGAGWDAVVGPIDGDGTPVELSKGDDGFDDGGAAQTPLMVAKPGGQIIGEEAGALDDNDTGGDCEDGDKLD